MTRPAGQYMGPAPVLPFEINPHLMVTSADATIRRTPPTLLDPELQRSLRWVVAVVNRCPYCARRHAHPMAQTAQWGWYTASCDPHRGYYLSNTPAAHDLTD